MDDEQDGVEIIDELGHHHHHHHHHHDHDDFGSGGEEDWQSDGSDGDQEDDEEDDGILDENMGDNLENIARALVGGDEDVDLLDNDREEGFLEDEGDEDDEMDGDEDDDEMDEDMMAEEYDDEDEGGSGIPWGWADDGDGPIVTRAQPRGTGGWFTLSGAPREPPVFSMISLL